MNVFDFDKTLYRGDSTLDFYFFCLRRQPSLLFTLPQQLLGLARFLTGSLSRDSFKEQFYCFLPRLHDIENAVELFWEEKASKMNPAILAIAQRGDVVVSASPEFLLRMPCKTLGLHLIASKVIPSTGGVAGRNCRGEEKVRRFLECFPNSSIETFYSDSESDEPLALLAAKSYLVVGGRPKDWPESLDSIS